MFLLVVSASDQAIAPTCVRNYEPMNFVLSQTDVPIYELITPEVNESYVQSLASSLFGLHDLVAQETEGIYFVNWSNSYLEVDSSDGSIWFAASEPAFLSLAVKITKTSFSASCLQISFPIPRFAPVTIAIFLLISGIFS